VTSKFTSGSVGIGGLVGTVNWGGRYSIEDSYATGNVTSSFGAAGGLLGGGAIPISRCYATGAVNAPMGSLAGGLATNTNVWVSNSFSTGVFSGTTSAYGGLLASSTFPSSSVRNNYWLKPAGSPFNCVLGAGGSGSLCTEVSDMSFFSQTNNALLSTWDFINVWYIPQPGALPLLRE
jgi:hypothetical protein